EELGVLRDRAGPAALDRGDAELVQERGDGELVRHGEVHPLLLGAVAQRGVVDLHAGGLGEGCGAHLMTSMQFSGGDVHASGWQRARSFSTIWLPQQVVVATKRPPEVREVCAFTEVG